MIDCVDYVVTKRKHAAACDFDLERVLTFAIFYS